MSRLKELQEALKHMEACRTMGVRGLVSTGYGSFGRSESHILYAINEMWPIICECAEANLKGHIHNEALRMRAEAEKVLS